jgi:hypothetical protein
MIKHFKILTMMMVLVVALVACGGNEPTTPENTAPSITGAEDVTIEFGATFDSFDALKGITANDLEDGDLTSSIEVDLSQLKLTTEGTYTVIYTVTDSEGLTSTKSITVTVLPEPGPTTEELINQDIDAYLNSLFESEYQLSMPKRGAVNRSTITYKSSSPYISSTGVVLPLLSGAASTTANFEVTFALNGVKITEVIEIDIEVVSEVEIASSRNVRFENLTTEYDVDNGELTLYFEEDGYVPYASVLDFFDLLQGFIDPEIEFTITETDTTLTLFYEYYSEDEDTTYDLEVTIDSETNLITTNDPGFYWAYVYSTETNFGRHIEYDIDNPDAHYYEGSDVVYDLNDYNLDLAVFDGKLLMPYYLMNQLFAGSSYYNVYYNNDALYGIYSLPDSSDPEYRTIKRSSMNDEDIPADLVVHNYNMLAFNLDYFYGLKEFKNINSFYDILINYKDALLSTDPEAFEFGLRDLLLKGIDEPHTSYGYPNYFNPVSFDGPPTNDLRYYGTRFTNWYYDGFVDVDTQIGLKWGEAASGWNANSGKRPNYWFLDDDKTSVVVTLNGFSTADMEESAIYTESHTLDILESEMALLPNIAQGNKFFYYNSSDETNRFMELLIKGVDASYVELYEEALIDFGYTFVKEDILDLTKQSGYYVINLNDQDYMVQVAYSDDYELFYVGITNDVPDTYTSEWPFTVDIKASVESDSAVYLEMTLDQIKRETSVLKNVLLDLTWNTGGNVGALYRVVGFITDQPFRTASISGATGGASSSYVVINGVPYDDTLNWGLLTSPLSFSAANSLVTIFKENHLGPIIGLRSGGGASSITPILLPSGTAFTMSSNNIGAYRTGSGTVEDPFVYLNNELGIDPTVLIDITEIYNEEVLLQIFE